MSHTGCSLPLVDQYMGHCMALKTLEEVRAEFDRCGVSVSSWAVKHGIPRNIASGVLQGRLKGKRGHAHNAAVLLGLKEGVVNLQMPAGIQD
jgi:gp16 family phage-associated protein